VIGGNCEYIDEFFRSIGLNITGVDIGCDGHLRTRNIHLYNCIQHVKKMHSSFDRFKMLQFHNTQKVIRNDSVFYEIILNDPKARFVVADSFQNVYFMRILIFLLGTDFIWIGAERTLES
jgi:hypothetical protein